VGDRKAGAEAAGKLLEKDARLRKKILGYAYKLTHNVADANDLAQGAIAKACDPERSPWDPEKQSSLLDHIGSIINSDLANKRRADERHPAEPYDDESRARLEPTALDRLIGAEEVATYGRWMGRLRVGLAGDDLALGKIDLMYREIDDAAEQAAILKCTVNDIYLANRRIAYQVELVKKEAAARPPKHPPDPTPEGGPEAER
jgi:DNA-directed RNA polymerase specialized sigma24 family protein